MIITATTKVEYEIIKSKCEMANDKCQIDSTILLKGASDTVFIKDLKEEHVTGGNAGMTKGGTRRCISLV